MFVDGKLVDCALIEASSSRNVDHFGFRPRHRSSVGPQRISGLVTRYGGWREREKRGREEGEGEKREGRGEKREGREWERGGKW